MPTRILLADDHEIVRQGVRLLLQQEGFEVAGEAANGQEAIRLARESCPDIALLDYGMPLLNGIAAAREITQACPKTKVILLTMHTDDQYVLEALRIGVKGFVVKSQAPAGRFSILNPPVVSTTLALTKSAAPASHSAFS